MADRHELRDKGLRLTPQRELVLAAVRALGHSTPEEVAEKVRLTHPGINLEKIFVFLLITFTFPTKNEVSNILNLNSVARIRARTLGISGSS